MVSLGPTTPSSPSTGGNRRTPPLSSDGRRLTISPRRLARIKMDSGCAAGSNADGAIITRAMGRLRLTKSRTTSSKSSSPPSTVTFRINCPRSAADGDSRPTGHNRLTAPFCGGQIEEIANDNGEYDEEGENEQQKRQAIG